VFDSRAFHLKAKDGSLMPSLLPGADMFNYRFFNHFRLSITPAFKSLLFRCLSLQPSAPHRARHYHQDRRLGQRGRR
jgi:hypothetical protein